MQPYNKDYLNLLVSHQDQVTEIGNKGVHLAENEFCKNDMIVWHSPNKNLERIFTYQSHVEYTIEFLKDLINSRIQLIDKYGEGRTKKALSTMEEFRFNDSATLIQWSINFLRKRFYEN
jgi:GMP synthase-like glutamine amidotransferase